MNYTNLTRENIKLYAAGNYSNPSCSTLMEFEEDYLRVKYIKVLINKVLCNKETNYRIILNHIICMANVFQGEATAKILFTEFDEEAWGLLCTLLVFLNLMPEKLTGINGKTLYICSMNIDKNFLERLREL